MEWRRFVTYLWNDPPTIFFYCGRRQTTAKATYTMTTGNREIQYIQFIHLRQ